MGCISFSKKVIKWKVAQVVTSFLVTDDKEFAAMQEMKVQSLEKELATHSSVLAWRNPWTEEPVGL